MKTPKTLMVHPSTTCKDFRASMPQRYCARYSVAESEYHAAIAASRQGAASIGVFERGNSVTGVCVVADDHPGLLAQMSEAFASNGLDIASAAAYTRTTRSGPEAVDLFWLRSSDDSCSIDETLIGRVQVALAKLIDGKVIPDIPGTRQEAETSSRNSRVRFIEGEDGALTTLEIETDDRSGLLLSLSRTMFAQHVQIISSEVKTVANRVIDRFVVAELDGSPVSSERRLELQVAILSAAEPAKRLSSASPPPTDAQNA